jgi:hypothetical protein
MCILTVVLALKPWKPDLPTVKANIRRNLERDGFVVAKVDYWESFKLLSVQAARDRDLVLIDASMLKSGRSYKLLSVTVEQLPRPGDPLATAHKLKVDYSSSPEGKVRGDQEPSLRLIADEVAAAMREAAN